MDAKKKEKAKTQSFSQKTEQKASHWKIRTKILVPMFHFIVFLEVVRLDKDFPCFVNILCP